MCIRDRHGIGRAFISGLSKGRFSEGASTITQQLIKNPKNPIELNKILAVLANRENDNELIYSFKTSELHVESEEEVPWTLDGEFGGSHTDLTITNPVSYTHLDVYKRQGI